MKNENQGTSKRSRGGRTPKLDPAVFRYTVRFSEVDNERFMALYERSGMQTKAHFITSRIFNEEFKVISIDKDLVDYHTKLTTLFSQFRKIGVNYNQVVKELHVNFSEKKALAFLYKLEKATLELVETNQQIIALSNSFANAIEQITEKNGGKD